MKRRLLRSAVIAWGVLASATASAGEAAEEFDWPVQSFFLSDVPQIQEPGAVQARAAFHLRSTPDGTQVAAPIEGELGVGRRFQLASEVQWNREYEQSQLERGVSEVAVGVRYGLLESADSGLAVSSGLDGQVARPEFSDDQWAVYGRLLAFKQVGALGLNAVIRPGFAHTRQGELEPRAHFGLGVALGSRTLVPTGEVRAELGDERSFEAVGGLKIKPAKVVELGAGALLGQRDGDAVYGATTSLIIDLGG